MHLVINRLQVTCCLLIGMSGIEIASLSDRALTAIGLHFDRILGCIVHSHPYFGLIWGAADHQRSNRNEGLRGTDQGN